MKGGIIIMEKKYTNPEIEVVEVEDVIVTSVNDTPITRPGDRLNKVNSDWE